MGLHRNARLGLAGRRRLVADVEAGLSCREAARRRGVSPTTACEWWRRWSAAGVEQRLTLACLEDRSSRPHRCPRLLPAAEQERICSARRRSGWGPRLIAGETGHPHATVWRTLKRAGISRPPRQPRERPRLYEWPCPGDLLHIDTKRFVRFSRPGHAVTGDRHRLRRTRPRALRGARDRGEQIALRQRLRLSAQPLAARAARPPRDPASLYQAAPAADQRQGRTIPTNPQTRVGTRSDLPLLRPPRPGTVTLAQLLQRAQTAQLTRRTPTPPISRVHNVPRHDT